MLQKSIGEQTSSVTYPSSSTSGVPSDLLSLEKELDRHIEEEILYDKATDTQAYVLLNKISFCYLLQKFINLTFLIDNLGMIMLSH